MALRSKKKHKDQPEDDEPNIDANEAEMSEELPEAEIVEDVPETEPERTTRERGEYLEAWQRSRADYQNLRRRLQTDIDSAVGRTKESMMLELLLVLDFMDMALAAPVETDEAKNLKYGVEMTRNQMLALLEREGVKIAAEEGQFDPSLDDAIEVVPDTGKDDGEIVQTTRKGYTIGERSLRPAQVRVAGTPEAAADENAGQESDDTSAND